MQRSLFLFFSLSVSVLFLFACGPKVQQGGSKSIASSEIDEIIYEDWGPPVAPQYNDTYKIILSLTNQTLAIDSLRSAGIEVEKPLSTADFERILELKATFEIELGPEIEVDGCVGGSGHTLTFNKNGEKLMEGLIIDCGGVNRTNIGGNFFAFRDAIRELAYGN